MLKLVECPRDAMQGFTTFIPTETKIKYLNKLLAVGFDTLDFGSFVSPKAIPQMQDTREVLESLEVGNSTKLLAIVANFRGAEQAASYDKITYLGFPFSISETFQQRNTNSSIKEAFSTVRNILDISKIENKEVVVYLSMGFGNPYGDAWNAEIVEDFTGSLVTEGCKIISLADTTGVSTPENISSIFSRLTATFPETEFGVHLHSTPDTAVEKIEAAYSSGCKRFDSALKGFGGCPMASDTLTGNISTEVLIDFLSDKENLDINQDMFKEAIEYSSRVFL